jgi:hypothetical protein
MAFRMKTVNHSSHGNQGNHSNHSNNSNQRKHDNQGKRSNYDNRIKHGIQSNSGSRVSSGSIVSDYGLDDRAIGFDPRQGQRIFSLASVSRPALGPTQPPVQWVPGSFPRGKARPGRDADHLPPFSAEVVNE